MKNINDSSYDNEQKMPKSKAKTWAISIVSILCILGIIGGITAGIMIPKSNEQPIVEDNNIIYKDNIDDYINNYDYYTNSELAKIPVTHIFNVYGEKKKTIISKFPKANESNVCVDFCTPISHEFVLEDSIHMESIYLFSINVNGQPQSREILYRYNDTYLRYRSHIQVNAANQYELWTAFDIMNPALIDESWPIYDISEFVIEYNFGMSPEPN